MKISDGRFIVLHRYVFMKPSVLVKNVKCFACGLTHFKRHARGNSVFHYVSLSKEVVVNTHPSYVTKYSIRQWYSTRGPQVACPSSNFLWPAVVLN
jgi:hypothetical protein